MCLQSLVLLHVLRVVVLSVYYRPSTDLYLKHVSAMGFVGIHCCCTLRTNTVVVECCL